MSQIGLSGQKQVRLALDILRIDERSISGFPSNLRAQIKTKRGRRANHGRNGYCQEERKNSKRRFFQHDNTHFKFGY